MTAQDLDWHRIAEHIQHRVGELGVPWADIARAAGVSDLTLRQLADARKTSYRKSTLASISRALGWTPGSIEEIGRGGDPLIPSVDKDVMAMLKLIESRLDSIDQRLPPR